MRRARRSRACKGTARIETGRLRFDRGLVLDRGNRRERFKQRLAAHRFDQMCTKPSLDGQTPILRFARIPSTPPGVSRQSRRQIGPRERGLPGVQNSISGRPGLPDRRLRDVDLLLDERASGGIVGLAGAEERNGIGRDEVFRHVELAQTLRLRSLD
jgi:hypothetical protein